MPGLRGLGFRGLGFRGFQVVRAGMPIDIPGMPPRTVDVLLELRARVSEKAAAAKGRGASGSGSSRLRCIREGPYTLLDMGPQNHSGDGLLGPNAIMVVYVDPLGMWVVLQIRVPCRVLVMMRVLY